MWRLTDEGTAEQLRRAFRSAGIDCSKPGFCDDREFLVIEQRDPRILEGYAHLIESQEYTPAYLDEARKKIEVVAEAVRAAIEADGSNSRCVHASAVIGRMLDELGIWNYQAKATLTITFPNHPEIEPVYFWAIDSSGREFHSPHAIIVAPPFGIIDVTVKYQPYSSDVKRNLLPEKIVTDAFERATFDAGDLADDNLRLALHMQRIPFQQFMERRLPKWLEVFDWLPARSMKATNVNLKYVIIGVSGLQERLKDIKSWTFAGRTPLQIYEQDVLPKL